MHSILALVKSPSTRIIHDWKGRWGGTGSGGEMDWEQKGGRNDHGSSCGAEMLLNGPQSERDRTLLKMHYCGRFKTVRVLLSVEGHK